MEIQCKKLRNESRVLGSRIGHSLRSIAVVLQPGKLGKYLSRGGNGSIPSVGYFSVTALDFNINYLLYLFHLNSIILLFDYILSSWVD